MKDKKLSLQQNMIWNMGGSIFYLGCQWLLTVIVVWISGYAVAGGLTLATTVCNPFYGIASYGMRNYQVSDIEGRYTDGTYIYSRIITGILSMALCVGFVFVNQYTIQQRICILLYMVFKLSEATFDVYAGIYQKAWRMDYIGKSMVARGILSLLFFVILLKVTGNLAITIGGMAVAGFLVVVFYDAHEVSKLTDTKLNLDQKAVKSLLIACFPLVVYVFLSSAINAVPRYFIELFMGEEQLGYYGAIATPTLIVQMAATYIFNPLVTVFAEKYTQKDKKGFWQLLKKCCMGILGVSALAFVGAGLFGKLALGIIYSSNKEILNYTYLLLPLIGCTILTAFSWFLGGLLTVIRDFKGLIISNVVAITLSIFSSWILVKSMGLQGGNVALLITLLVEILIMILCLVRKVKKAFKEPISMV